MALTSVSSTSDSGRNQLESQIQCLNQEMDGRHSPYISLQETSSTTSTFISDIDAPSSPVSAFDTSTDATQSSCMMCRPRVDFINIGGRMRLNEPSTDRTHGSASNSYQSHSARRSLLPEGMSLCDRLNALRTNDFLCDVTVICNDRVFPAHQAVLVAASNVCTLLIEAACELKCTRDTKLQNQLYVAPYLPESRSRSCVFESPGYQLLPRVCPSFDTEIASGTSTSVNIGCTERTDANPSHETDTDESVCYSSNSACNAEPRFRGGGETHEQAVLHDCSSICQTDVSTPPCYLPATGEEESIATSKDQTDLDFSPAVKQAVSLSENESNVYVVLGTCSKKELEVTVENQRIRVKTVTSSVACSKSATFSSKPMHASINVRQLHYNQGNSGCSSTICSQVQLQSAKHLTTDFKSSRSMTEDSGVSLPEYAASEPNSSRPVSDLGNVPVKALNTDGHNVTNYEDSNTSCDLISLEGAHDSNSETTNNGSGLPLRKCNSGTSLSNPVSWECGTEFDAFTETVSEYTKLMLPYHDMASLNTRSVSSTQQADSTISGTHGVRPVSPVYNGDLSITIDSVDPDVFDVLLEFAYSNSYKKLKNLPVEKFPEVNLAARKLEMSGVNVLCSQAFSEAVTQKNFVDLWNLADRAQSKELGDIVVKYLVYHLDSLWMSPHLLQLPYQRMIRVLLEAGNASVNMKPDLVLRTYIAWIKMDPSCRSHTVKPLWPLIQRLEISPDYARRLLTQDQFVKSFPELQAQLTNICSKSLLPATDLPVNKPSSIDLACRNPVRKGSRCSIRVTARTRSDNELYVSKRIGERQVVVNLKKEAANIARKIRFSKPSAPPSCATPVKQKLGPAQLLTMLPIVGCRRVTKSPSVSGFSVRDVFSSYSNCHLDLNFGQPPILVIGKSEPFGTVVVLKLEMNNGVWAEEVFELDEIMEDKQAVHFHDTYVILAGGEKNGYSAKKLRTVRLCDMRANWTVQVPDMHIARCSAAIFMVGATLYVAGGKGRYEEDVSEVESLEVTDRALRWKMMPSMKVKRSSHSIVTTESGCAFAIGGGTSRCERYHPKLKKWTDLPSLPQEFSRFDPVQVAVKNDLVAMIRHRPGDLYVLDEERRAWIHCRMTGRQPSAIVSVSSWEQNIVVVDDKKMVFSFVLGENEWQCLTKIVRPHFKSVMIIAIEDKSKFPDDIKWMRSRP